MDLRTLRAFVEVVRQGSFSAAAPEVCASQPTVSKAVKQLEDEIGLPLLDRSGRQIRLTTAGECVFRHAIAMLAERESLKNDLCELSELKTGCLRLGLSRLGSSIHFARLIADYRNRFPGVELELVEHGALFLQQALRKGALDLAMCMLPIPEDLERELVYDEPLMAMLPRAHPLAQRSSITLAELADTPFILFEQGFALNPQIQSACQRAGFSPRIAAYSGQSEFILALVEAGLGVAFMPRLICHGIASVACVLLEDDMLQWRIVLAWQRDLPLFPATRAFLGMARATLRNPSDPRIVPLPKKPRSL